MKYYATGQLATLTQHTIVTIRYYEKCGLLPKPKRSHGGFRLYPESIIPRFYFIQNAKAVGFDLTEIKVLLDLQAGKAPSQQIKTHTQQKIPDITNKITTLQKMKRALSKWEQACDGKIDIDQCPILENLYQPPENIKECLHDSKKD